MMLAENFRQAYTSLAANKKRSVLTMLGIVIGLSSVLFIVSIGDTVSSVVSRYVTQNVMGGNVLVYTPFNNTNDVPDDEDEDDDDDEDTRPEFRSIADLGFCYEEIYDFLENNRDIISDVNVSCSFIGNSVSAEGTLIMSGTDYSASVLRPVSSCYDANAGLRLKYGRFITFSECREAKPVAVISDVAAENLYGSADNVLGNSLLFRDKNGNTSAMTVIGVYEYIDNYGTLQSASDKRNVSTEVYCPFTFADASLGILPSYTRENGMFIIAFDVPDIQKVSDASDAIYDFVNSKYGDDPDFDPYVENMGDFVRQIQDMIRIISVAFSFISSVALVVGGIGLMNTMLVSVTERTKEIGIKKALGARTSTIRVQFLIESALLCLTACAAGIFLGMLIGMLVESNLDKLIALIPQQGLRYFLLNTPIHFTPSLNAVVVSTLFSLAVGIIFGLYPANKGAKMQPVDALRYE